MVTKRELLEQNARGEGCLGKTADDEEVFLLCGRDKTAPIRIRDWATAALRYGVREDKVKEAMGCADRMELTPNRKLPD